ncbi:hypothetical protein CDAR_533511 [Caerostris darwini]|uniref:Uncharacterized protein n=1 Tax=Caerostris darwini TaxID=1538125 RepID=A0AAV4S4G0_9ARAC|nr:hypothetical protein CDAR_533511 [Caerostris darwini]
MVWLASTRRSDKQSLESCCCKCYCPLYCDGPWLLPLTIPPPPSSSPSSHRLSTVSVYRCACSFISAEFVSCQLFILPPSKKNFWLAVVIEFLEQMGRAAAIAARILDDLVPLSSIKFHRTFEREVPRSQENNVKVTVV